MICAILLPWLVSLINLFFEVIPSLILMQDSSGIGLPQRQIPQEDDISRAISLSLEVFQILYLCFLFVLSLYLVPWFLVT